MYRINHHISVGFILLCSYLLLSCNNTSLDDCEKQFIQNLGISNTTYSTIQDKDRFLSREELAQFEAAYFGEGSDVQLNDAHTFYIITDGYDVCRKGKPLNKAETHIIGNQIIEAFRVDSISFLRFNDRLDSLREFKNLLLDTMRIKNLKYSRNAAVVSDENYLYNKLSSFLKNDISTTDKVLLESFGIQTRYDAETMLYSTDVYFFEKMIDRYQMEVPMEYFKTIESIGNFYGWSNIDSNLLASLPHPEIGSYEYFLNRTANPYQINRTFKVYKSN